METKIYDGTQLVEAAQELKKGNLVAFPTETVYGLGANALLPDSVKQVFTVKGRPQDNPLIVHVASFEQVKAYVDNFHPATEKIVKNFWPGPLTLIFKIKKDSLPSIVTGGLSTAAFRMPDNTKTLEVIRTAGVPIVGPSANTSGKPSPTTAKHVYHDLHGKITGIVDDGATRIGVESTVIDLSDPTADPMILRPGAVTKEALEAVIKKPVTIDRHLVQADETPKAPGMKYKHYSPDTRVLMVENDDWEAAVEWAKDQHFRTGVLAGPTIVENVRESVAATYMYQDDSVTAATKGLFAGLRGLDEKKLALDLIFVQVVPEEGLGIAYMNRLKKAAGQNYFKK
ncbi:Sua5/YciO/YrdC/YwlC family tRNA threonylcarbamoyl adenosine modification protein [Enterococcus sp. 10A9_DIV0425]|uniref:Threonylcarbamoyl-AMP synthase n=1 Tax=Candidatus Enterococcus wittei TaxID=1987383 RepID=A0A242JY43_9ENTE|nr:L-threonylcarbamoyladenylate synthase [Enterococcus sp. 10A9_DIV0425]OTP10235.1 Sua5/YciO/YrdC/YwlC family tRNA threonylcarbamoyl adenosine modification protein [Enterococcus sp. 10A9_DIV0425]THE08856.1 threonylcarbamoyl-AMP synthase [Enterococcus hirae]